MGRLASKLLALVLAESNTQPSRFRWVSRDLGAPLVDLEDYEAVHAVLDRQR